MKEVGQFGLLSHQILSESAETYSTAQLHRKYVMSCMHKRWKPWLKFAESNIKI